MGGLKMESPVFMTDADEVRAFVRRCMEDELLKQDHWTKARRC